MEQFEGRVAVVTGAADGLGRAVAGRAARLGMKLVLADTHADALEEAADALLAGGSEVLAMVCDVGKGAHVEELADAALVRFHGVHLLFNHACVVAGGLCWESSEADWNDALGANLWGAIHGARVFLPLMLECADRDRGYCGHIVNTVPHAALAGLPLLAPNNVAAQGVLALSETLHHDLRLVEAPVGISVLCADAAVNVHPEPTRRRTDGVRTGHVSTPGRRAAEALLADALCAGRPDAEALGALAFEAIREGRFCIGAGPGAADVPGLRQPCVELDGIRKTLRGTGPRA